MRIFITGATGLLGRRLVADRLQRGDSLVVLSRSEAKAAKALAPDPNSNLQVVKGDPRRKGDWRKSINGCDAVIHLAGQPVADRRWSRAYKQLLWDSRVLSTRRIAGAICASHERPGVFICASATGYYRDTGDRPTTETGKAGRDFLARLCAAWEAESEKAWSQRTRVVRLRLGIVLDKQGGALKKMMRPFRMFVGGRLGSGQQHVPWIHWQDALGIVDLALSDAALRGAVNATAPNPVTNKELSRAIGQALGRPAWLPAPAFALRLALGEFADCLLTSQRVIPAAALKHGYEFRYPELKTALDALLKN
ncbi:MAG: TIGR01777 family oxidoreductase [Phycisphaerales bacterium]|nr:MAG: TIGR01777 family oxidoreductase [Phycisphaerales bacterium]